MYRLKTRSSCRHTYKTKRPRLNEKKKKKEKQRKLLLPFDLKIIDLVNQLQTRSPFKSVITINVTLVLLTISSQRHPQDNVM